ncbi:MAG: hypothetical protein DDT34_02458 [Firmicutes bacterium]|nr:hypothetical protein [Bacillota bacterium]
MRLIKNNRCIIFQYRFLGRKICFLANGGIGKKEGMIDYYYISLGLSPSSHVVVARIYVGALAPNACIAVP